MSSSTVSRYREPAAVTSPIKVYDQNNCSFAEDYALDAIAKEVEEEEKEDIRNQYFVFSQAELRLQYQRDQTREARQTRYRELEQNARENDDEDPLIISKVKTRYHSNSNAFVFSVVNCQFEFITKISQW